LWVAWLWLLVAGSRPWLVVVAGCGSGWEVCLVPLEEGHMEAPPVEEGADRKAGLVVEVVAAAGHMVALALVAAAVVAVDCLLVAEAACRVGGVGGG
jgi:hypothetical protein